MLFILVSDILTFNTVQQSAEYCGISIFCGLELLSHRPLRIPLLNLPLQTRSSLAGLKRKFLFKNM
jgi:hypothetical protein